MKKIQFMFYNLGPYIGLHDGTSFMGVDNIYVDSHGLKQIIKDYVKYINPNPKDPIYAELSSLQPAWDGLICLSAMKVRMVDGYFIYEYKDCREASLDNAKEILLDGHYFNILTYSKSQLKYQKSIREYGFDIISHGKFDSLEEAHLYLDELGISNRTSTWPGQQDEDILRGEVLARRYIYPEYKIGDLGRSITEIPENVVQMSPGEIAIWANSMLNKAQEIQPEVYWFDGQIPLEIKILRIKAEKDALMTKVD